MHIVTSTCVLPMGYPEELALDRLARIGFTHLDMAIDYCLYKDSPFLSDNWTDWAKSLREKAENLGVRYTHSHACADAADPRGVERSLALCQILGAGYTVVHPIWRKPDGSFYESDDEFLSVNVPAIRPMVEKAVDYGVTILSENLLWGASIRAASVAKLVQEVSHPRFGWCYDTGHAKGCGQSYRDLVGLPAPLSLHIQDNHGPRNGGLYDDHLLPGDGAIDWKGFLDTLHEVGYKGEMVLEAHHQSLDAPDAERDGILTELLHRAERLRAYFTSLT